MLKNTMKMILPLAATVAFVTPAFAFQCPGDIAKIDSALQTASLSEADLTEVTALRATGEQQHGAGSHADAIESLAKAMKILEIK